jgi:hypothetical protein
MTSLSLLQLEFLILIACLIIFIVIYAIHKKFKTTKDLIWDSIMDAITLCSGIILLLYLIGKVFQIEYLNKIDDFSLIIGLLIAGLVIIGGSIDKIRGKKNEKETN